MKLAAEADVSNIFTWSCWMPQLLSVIRTLRYVSQYSLGCYLFSYYFCEILLSGVTIHKAGIFWLNLGTMDICREKILPFINEYHHQTSNLLIMDVSKTLKWPIPSQHLASFQCPLLRAPAWENTFHFFAWYVPIDIGVCCTGVPSCKDEAPEDVYSLKACGLCVEFQTNTTQLVYTGTTTSPLCFLLQVSQLCPWISQHAAD